MFGHPVSITLLWLPKQINAEVEEDESGGGLSPNMVPESRDPTPAWGPGDQSKGVGQGAGAGTPRGLSPRRQACDIT